MKNLKTERTISWTRMLGLATLHGAITITWLVYNLYLPELLLQFGFSLVLVQIILIVENLITAVIEPTAGSLSDQALRRWHNRFPVISGGVIVAAAVFVIIPLMAIIWSPTGITRWLLPILLTIWALTMATFRSPSLVLLKKTASNNNLPQAAAVLTIIAGIFAAIRPFANGFILSLGPLAAFTIGSASLLIGLFVLRRLFPPDEAEPTAASEPQASLTLNRLSPHIHTLALIAGAGLGGAWSFRLTTSAVSKLLRIHLPQLNNEGLMALFFFLLAFAALPLGTVAAKRGNHQTMLSGAAAAAVGLALATLWPTSLLWPLIIIVVLIGLSTTTTGAVPLALSLIPSRWSGLAIGIYFGGFTLGTSLLEALFEPILDSTSSSLTALLAAASFLLSWVCIDASRTALPDQKSRLTPQTALITAGSILAMMLLLSQFS